MLLDEFVDFRVRAGESGRQEVERERVRRVREHGRWLNGMRGARHVRAGAVAAGEAAAGDAVPGAAIPTAAAEAPVAEAPAAEAPGAAAPAAPAPAAAAPAAAQGVPERELAHVGR